MNTKLVKTVLVAYSKIRRFIEPLMFKLFSQKTPYNKHKWDLAKAMDINDFDNYINTFEYKSDKAMGLFDMVFPLDKPEYFFADLKWGRDCDDFARIWAIYLKRTGDWESIKEQIVLDSNKPFSSAHVILTAKNKNTDKYWLFNYKMLGPYDNEEKAVKGCITDRTTSYVYKEETFLWTTYRSI